MSEIEGSAPLANGCRGDTDAVGTRLGAPVRSIGARR